MSKRIADKKLFDRLLKAPMKEFDKNSIFEKQLKKALRPRGRKRVFHKPFYEE